MKKKSASQSAFFNLRVLIGLCIILAGVFLALLGLGTFSALTASSAHAQQKPKLIDIQGLPPGFDCSKIHELGIDRMENLRAGRIMIACGEAEGGSASTTSPLTNAVNQAIEKVLAPLAYGAADVDLINHPETSPNITQSETYSLANPDNPNQILVAYNDSRGRNVTPSISPAHRTPATVASRSIASPILLEETKARLAGLRATPLLCTTAQPAPGSQSGSTRAAAVAASAGTSPRLLRILPRLAGPISAFTAARATTESLAGWTKTHPLPS